MSMIWAAYVGGGTELLTLLALADWADDDGRCWPSIASIAKKSRLSRSQAQRIVHRLIADGVVSVVGNELGGAPGATRQYRINPDKLTGRIDATPTGRMGATGSAGATGSMDAAEGSHLATQTGSTHATQTTSEPSRTTKCTHTRKSSPAEKKEPAGFSECWAAYPKRAGANNRQEAMQVYRARIENGIDPAVILAGVKRYATYCDATEATKTQFVKQAKTFFGKSQHWLEPWTIPTAKSRKAADADLHAIDYAAGLPKHGNGTT